MMDAQRVVQPKAIEFDKKGVVYKSEKAFQLRLHEQGATIGYYKGKIKTYYKTQYYQFELGYQKDVRERRQNKNYQFAGEGPSNSFAFGKINNVINLRASLGVKRYLSEKVKRNGLAVGYSYEIGPSIAILKPYYLKLIYFPSDSQPQVEVLAERYTEENAEKFLNVNDIYGSEPYAAGLSEVSIVPGIQSKVALHFALGAFDKYMRVVETGLMMDLYTRRIPILVETEERKNSPYFLKFFVSVQIGTRSNK